MALEIAQKFPVKKNTIFKWKERKKIPDKYLTEIFNLDPIIQKKILTFLYKRKIGLRFFATYGNMNVNRLKNIMYEGITMNKKDHDKIKITLDKIRSEIEQIISDFDKKKITYPLFNFLWHYPDLCYTRIFNDRTILNWKNQNNYTSTKKIQKWIDKLREFYIEIQLLV